ncbi:MAG TPA: AAA family ATPase [Pseudonocardiaceae bacterium]|jgi:DNA-binding CsgD family transcriptional regulator
MLHGRSGETARLERLLVDARAGRSGALVVRGEAGIGKTALLEHALSNADGMRVVHGVGIQSESELAFAALHLLLRPALEHLTELPQPQADALSGAFGLVGGRGSDRFLVGLATLSLLSDLAGDGALLCVVDDAHWLDQASADALIFAARRLDREGVALVFAARDAGFAAPGLPELRLAGIDSSAARAVLHEHLPGLSPSAVERVLAESAGNPLALRELPGMIGQAPPLTPLLLPERIQRSYYAQVAGLPRSTRTLLLVASAEETGDLDVILRAALALGAPAAAIDPAERAGLVTVALLTVTFRHPLVRTAIYQGSTFAERAAAHTALASVLTSDAMADRRAWHRAAAATGPDESVARELELTATRARQRLGYATAATALAHAARLTVDQSAKARRLAAAATAAMDAGRAEAAVALAGQATELTDDAVAVAAMASVRAWAAIEEGAMRTAYDLLVSHADAITDREPGTAVTMLAGAVRAGWWLADADMVHAAADRLTALATDLTQTSPTWIHATANMLSGHVDEAMGPLIATARAALAQPPEDLDLRMYVVDSALLAGDFDTAMALTGPAANDVRAQGVIRWFGLIQLNLAYIEFHRNRFQAAGADGEEGLRIAFDTNQPVRVASLRAVLALVAAVEGDEARCRDLAARSVEHGYAEQNATLMTGSEWALALLDLGLGNYDAALARFLAMANGKFRHFVFTAYCSCVPDLIEAAFRAGQPELAEEPLARFAEWAHANGHAWADAVLHRCRALFADDAEPHFAAALRGHDAADRPFDRARTALLYGEWLRRHRRAADARDQLNDALSGFVRLGANPWAERARTELRAAGGAAQDQPADTDAVRLLTPQELQVVRLAAAGATNRDIAARLFISPRTVSHHLYRAFPKLGVSTRTALAHLDFDNRQ